MPIQDLHFSRKPKSRLASQKHDQQVEKHKSRHQRKEDRILLAKVFSSMTIVCALVGGVALANLPSFCKNHNPNATSSSFDLPSFKNRNNFQKAPCRFNSRFKEFLPR